MIDLYLTFPDTATGLSALAGYDAQETGVVSGPWGLLACGLPVILTPATTDDAGDVVTPSVFVPGFHANLRLSHETECPVALVPYSASPNNPQHGWAGGT